MAVISTRKTCALILGMLGAVGAAVAAPVDRFSNGATTVWTASSTYLPSWLDPGLARPGLFGADVTPALSRPLAGNLPFTLDFHPNGDGIEVDAPTGIVYSPDGEYILVPAKGKAPNTASLSVHSATDLTVIRIIPLTHMPEAFALMTTQPRAVLVNPNDDTVTVVDYEAGAELAIIPVGNLPKVIAITQDDATAVIQGGILSFGEEASWSIIDLSALTETDRFEAPGVNTGIGTVIASYGTFLALDPPVLTPDGSKAAIFQSDSDLSLLVIDLETHEETLVPIASNPEGYVQRLHATPDASLIVVCYLSVFQDWHVVTIDTTTWETHDVNVGFDDFGYSPGFLIKADGSKIALPTESQLKIVDTTSGAVISADVSGFPYDFIWEPVANLGAGDHFLVWNWGAGDQGYQVFDWDGVHAAELVVPDLTGNGDVFTQLAASSPGTDFRLAFVDPMKVSEDLVLLDLDPSNPQVVMKTQLGDDIEGDAAIKLSVSADQSTALVLNAQSSNAYFLDPQTMKREWIDLPKYVTDAVLTPDGTTAGVIAGAPGRDTPIAPRLVLVDRGTGASSDISLPGNAYGRALAVDSTGDYIYTLLRDPADADSELARISTTTHQMDPVRVPVPLWLGLVPLRLGFLSDVLVSEVELNDDGRWLAQSHDGQILAVASMSADGTDSRVTLIDKTSWSVITDVALGTVGTNTWKLVFSPDDTRLYVVGQVSISLIAVNGASSSLISQRPAENNSWCLTDLVISPADSKLYVSVWPFEGMPHGVQVLESETLLPITTIALPIQDDMGLPPDFWSSLNGPMHLRWSEDGSKLYAFSLNGEVHAIDPVSDQVLASTATGFQSPTSVVPLAGDSRGTGERFLMASFNSANDGIAVLTIEEPVVDVIFESGFEQD